MKTFASYSLGFALLCLPAGASAAGGNAGAQPASSRAVAASATRVSGGGGGMTRESSGGARSESSTPAAERATVATAKGIGQTSRGGAGSPGKLLSGAALMRHVEFFDKDHNGEIPMRETFKGGERLGMSKPTSVILAGGTGVFRALIPNLKNSDLSLRQRVSTKVYVKEVAHSIFKGNSGLFDGKGNSSAARVNDLFTRTGAKNDRLTLADIKRVTPGNKLQQTKLLAGWKSLFKLVGRDYLTREEVEHLASDDPKTPTLFDDIAARVAAERDAASGGAH